ncbi:unnamed protein product [marine sediment metagenome]|uniref:Uncharacterized protein n=1 Tax=marine sediment metagenome TaxID=412755 RepID=X0W6U0_9ZZZZ
MGIIEQSAFKKLGSISINKSVNIKTLEDFNLFMTLVYQLNPDKTEDEIDDIIQKGIQEKK